MKEIAAAIILILALFIGLALASGWSNERAASYEYAKGQAQALVISARAEAALDRAAAAQIVMLGAFPWGILFVLSLFGMAVVSLVFVLVMRQPLVIHTPPQIITREIIYLQAPDQPRREVWARLSDGVEIKRG